MALEREWQTYQRFLADGDVDAHTGQFVLIYADELCGFHADFGAALRAGYSRFGPTTPFLVTQIGTPDLLITTRATSCPTSPGRSTPPTDP